MELKKGDQVLYLGPDRKYVRRGAYGTVVDACSGMPAKVQFTADTPRQEVRLDDLKVLSDQIVDVTKNLEKKVMMLENQVTMVKAVMGTQLQAAVHTLVETNVEKEWTIRDPKRKADGISCDNDDDDDNEDHAGTLKAKIGLSHDELMRKFKKMVEIVEIDDDDNEEDINDDDNEEDINDDDNEEDINDDDNEDENSNNGDKAKKTSDGAPELPPDAKAVFEDYNRSGKPQLKVCGKQAKHEKNKKYVLQAVASKGKHRFFLYKTKDEGWKVLGETAGKNAEKKEKAGAQV